MINYEVNSSLTLPLSNYYLQENLYLNLQIKFGLKWYIMIDTSGANATKTFHTFDSHTVVAWYHHMAWQDFAPF